MKLTKRKIGRFSLLLSLVLAISVLLPAESTADPGWRGKRPDEPAYEATDVVREQIPLLRGDHLGRTVAVIPYVNKTLSEYASLGDAAVGILPEFLLEAGLQPIEALGEQFDSLLEERDYGQSDGVNAASAVRYGEQLGAQYIFIGEVNSYRVVKPSGGQSLSLSRFNLKRGGGRIVYDLQISGRIVNVETRAIIASKTVAHNQSFKIRGGSIQTQWGAFGQDQSVEVDKDVGGKVLSAALSRLVAELVNQLNRRV